MTVNLLIKNGHLLDPAQGIDWMGDIAIHKGTIVALDRSLDMESELTLQANGYLVTPGLLDIHTHFYDYGTWNGIPADLYALPMGITAIADAGSAGVANYRGLKAQMANSRVRTKMMLNVAPCGIIAPLTFPEPVDPQKWDYALFDQAIRECGDDLIALKLRGTCGVLKDLGLEPLKKMIELAERYGLRAVIHVTDAPASMGEIASELRPGDVFCHVYHGVGNTIFDAQGNIAQEIVAARARGVIFDSATGRGNYSLDIAKAAIEKGFLPDTITSDVTWQNWHKPIAGTLPEVMSRFLALGMSVSDIIERTTTEPAKQFHVDGLGTLQCGTPADITIMDLIDRECVFQDRFGAELPGKQLFVPKATIINGNILYRAADF